MSIDPPHSTSRQDPFKVRPQAMYTLRSADQQEHGPLSTRDVRDWISSGRATGETEARADDEATWRPLSQFVEFQPALQGAVAASLPPALPAQKPNRIVALIAFVLSFIPLIASLLALVIIIGTKFNTNERNVVIILALTLISVVTTFPTLVLGTIAIVLAKKKPRQFGDKRRATAALIMCLLSIICLTSAAYFGFNKTRRQMYDANNCYVHARSLSMSLRVLSIAGSGTYPNADTWCDAIAREVTSKEHYKCPDDPQHGTCGFAYNEKMSGAKDPNPNTVMIFESDLGWNGVGGIADVTTNSRHHGRIVVGLANGQVRGVRPQELKSLRWEP